MATPEKLTIDIFIPGNPHLDGDSHVAALVTGGFVITHTQTQFTGNTDTVARSIGSEGYAETSPYLGAGPENESQTSIVGLQDGSTVAVWRSQEAGDTDAAIVARRWDPKTNSFSSAFNPAEDVLMADFVRPETIELTGGLLAFAWINSTTDEIKASIYGPHGNPVVTDITVSIDPADQLNGFLDLGLTALSNGNFVVTWRNNDDDCKFRIVKPDGDFATGELEAEPSDGQQSVIDVTLLADGRFVVTFYDTTGENALFGKIFNEDGSVSVDRFQISTAPGHHAVAALKDGRFMAVYGQGNDIHGRIMNADGTPGSDQFLVTNDATDIQTDPSIDTLADGRVVVSWTDMRTGAGDIYYTIFDPRESGVEVTGTGYADKYKGSAFDDMFSLGGGNDQVYARAGNDQVLGGAGDDTLIGEAGNDVLNGGAGADTIIAGSDQDQLLGGAGNDSLFGNEGNDVLDGGTGADIMYGQSGDDTFRVDHASDKTVEDSQGGSDIVFTTVSYTLAANQQIELLATSSQAGTGSMTLTGNELGQRINGNDGNNILYGGAGDDLLVGYGGNDNIEGQNGLDTLKGVSGADKFVFRYSTIATAGTDHIADFGADDFIYVDHPSVTGPLNAAAFVNGADALDANDRFLYDVSTGNLYFDQDGNAAAAKVLMAVLDNKFALTAADIILF